MIELVDSHCHIQSIGQTSGEAATRDLWAKAENLTPETVITNARTAGVNKLIVVGCDSKDSALASDFVQDKAKCYAAIGIHPHEAKHFNLTSQAELASFENLLSKKKTVAIGECGLDYFYEHSHKTSQIKVLEYQVDLAIKHNLPIIFHVRQAFNDFWPVINNFNITQPAVLHSFTDLQSNAVEAIKRGWYIGINGIATFNKDLSLRTVYQNLPLDSIVLETDAPFLTPVPFRGKINEPMRVGEIAKFLAALRGEDLSVLAAATTANANKLFNL